MKKLFSGPCGRDKSTAHLGRCGEGGVRAEAHSGPLLMGASIFSHLSFNSDALDCVAAGDTSSQPEAGQSRSRETGLLSHVLSDHPQSWPRESTAQEEGEGMWKSKMWRPYWKWSKCPCPTPQTKPDGSSRSLSPS